MGSVVFLFMSKSFYRRALPHYTPNDRPYFLTFRLAGSNPTDNELLSSLLIRRKFLEYDQALDSMKSGPHHLRDPRVATVVNEALHHRDGKDYELHAFTIMSNHIRMVVSLAPERELFTVLQQLKSWTARERNKILSLQGEFWLHEGYDHVTRKGRLGNVVAYVLNNPVKAGIVSKWRDHPWTYLSPDLHGFE
jgi:putative transposase